MREESRSTDCSEEPRSLRVILTGKELALSKTESPMEQRTESRTFIEATSGSDDGDIGEIDIKLQDNLNNDIRMRLKSVLSREMNGIEFKKKNKRKLVREMLKNHSVLYQG